MLGQEGELAVDVIEVLYLKTAILLRKDHVAATVGQTAVAVGIAQVPVQEIPLAEGVAALQAEVVGRTALVVVLCLLHVVALCVISLAVGIAVLARLVEDLLQFHPVVLVGREPHHAQQGTQPDLRCILIIGGAPQVVGAVVGLVIGTEHVVGDVLQGALRMAVVQTTRQAPRLRLPRLPAVGHAGCQREVGQGLAALHRPVVVETVAQQRVAVALGSQHGVYAILQAPLSAVESQEVGGTPLAVQVVTACRLGVHAAAHAQAPGVLLRYVLGVHLDETSGKVGGIVGCRRLDHLDMVYL